MKKIFLVLLLSVLTAWSPTLFWDRNPEPDVVGYRVYRSKETLLYTSVVDVGNEIEYSIPDTEVGVTEYYAVTAYNTDGLESDFSDEVSYRPGIFITWRLPVGSFLIESCDDLTAAIWNFLTVIVGPVDYLISVDPDVPHRFYRYNPALGSSSTGILNRRNTVLRVNGK